MTPYPYHAQGFEKGLKIYALRKEQGEKSAKLFGCSSKDYSLLAFAANAQAHMETHRMNTVFYIKDLLTLEMKNLFNFHSCFTILQAKAWIDTASKDGTFDKYNKKNLKDSCMWLMNHLDSDLVASICPFVFSRTLTGPMVWMQIVGEVQLDSI
jgi:hypothetical protein